MRDRSGNSSALRAYRNLRGLCGTTEGFRASLRALGADLNDSVNVVLPAIRIRLRCLVVAALLAVELGSPLAKAAPPGSAAKLAPHLSVPVRRLPPGSVLAPPETALVLQPSPPESKEATSPETANPPPTSLGDRLRGYAQQCSGIPCTRPGVARVVAGAAGLLSLAGGTAMILLNPRWSEPGGYFAGSGPVALGGALIGTIVGVLSNERESVDDRVTPATIGLTMGRGSQAPFGEKHPAGMSVQAAPILRLKGQRAYVRVLVDGGGQLGPKTVVDPRPQADFALSGKMYNWSFAGTIEIGTWTPYPARSLKRPGHFGPVEILARTTVAVRRERLVPAHGDPRLLERVLVIPIAAGIRWHLSARQRLTTYVGPRLDFVNVGADGRRIDSRGGVQAGRSFGETWYDIDFPLTAHRRQYKAQAKRWNGSGQLRLGYRHAMFDGKGLNGGAVIGFTGPMYVGWAMRWRSPGAAWAMQAAAGLWIANEWAGHVDFGIVAPDIRPSRYRALYRWKNLTERLAERRTQAGDPAAPRAENAAPAKLPSSPATSDQKPPAEASNQAPKDPP